MITMRWWVLPILLAMVVGIGGLALLGWLYEGPRRLVAGYLGPYRRNKVRCLMGRHQFQRCGCDTLDMCIWCLKRLRIATSEVA